MPFIPVTETIVKELIRHDTAGRYVVPDSTSKSQLVDFYKKRVQKYTLGRSFMTPDDVPYYGSTFNSTNLNNLQNNIEYDLLVHYSEAFNVESFLNSQKNFLNMLVSDSIKYLNNASNRIKGFIEANYREVFFTDTVHNTFQYNDNDTDVPVKLDIDTDVENVKLLPYKYNNHVKEHVSYLTVYPLTYGMRIYETVSTAKMYNNDKTDPYYMIFTGEDPVGRQILQEDMEAFDGVAIAVKIAFVNTKMANRLRIGIFSTDYMDIQAIYYNLYPGVSIKHPSWTKVDILHVNKEDNPFVMEAIFERVEAKEFMVILKQSDYLMVDDVYIEEDINPIDTKAVLDELRSSLFRTRSMRRIDENYVRKDPLADAASVLSKRIKEKKRMVKPTHHTKQYIIGLYDLKLEDVDYINHGYYRSETITADGNIYKVKFEADQFNKSITEDRDLDTEDETYYHTGTNYSIILGGKEYPISEELHILDAVEVSAVEESGILKKYCLSRFLVDDTKDIWIHYNDKRYGISSISRYDANLTSDSYLIEIDDPDNEILPDSIIGLEYDVPSYDDRNRVYDPSIFDVKTTLGVPNLIVPETTGMKSVYFYLPMINGDSEADWYSVHKMSTNIVDIQGDVPSWDASLTYPEGYKIKHNGKIYRAIQATTNNEPPNGSYWIYIDDYTNTTEHVEISAKDLPTSYIMNFYNNTFDDPKVLISYKDPNRGVYDSWSSSIDYEVNDQIEYSNTIYECLKPSGPGTGVGLVIPTFTTDWEEYWTDSVYFYFIRNDVLYPVDGFYYGVIRGTEITVQTPPPQVHTINGEDYYSVQITDEGTPIPYVKGTLIVKHKTEWLDKYVVEYFDDIPTLVRDKYYFYIQKNYVDGLIPTPYSNVNDYLSNLEITFSPIDAISIYSSTNIKSHNQIDYLNPGDKYILTKYPFIDNSLVVDIGNMDLHDGIFYSIKNPSVTYEPVVVYVGKTKAINMTDYRNEGKGISTPVSRRDFQYEVKGREIVFNQEINSPVTVYYYALANSIAMDLLCVRINNKRNDISPVVENWNLLVDVRK